MVDCKRALSQARAFESFDGVLFMTWGTFKILFLFYFGLVIIFGGLITLYAIGHAVKFILYGFELWLPSSLKTIKFRSSNKNPVLWTLLC